MTSFKKQLESITHLLITTPLNYGIVRNAAYSLKELFLQATGFEETETTLKHIETPDGRAVSPVSAAFCIIDFIRTRVFIQGINEAIKVKQAKKPGQPVTILYAGCGPFATLVTPLTCLYSPAELQLVLMDINPHALSYLSMTIDTFEIRDYVKEIIPADASVVEIKNSWQPDIIVSETMMPGLRKEPIVNIYANLAVQLPEATLIPEQVKIIAAVLSSTNNSNYTYLPFETLLDLSAENARLFNDNEWSPAIFRKGVEVSVPENLDPAFRKFCLLTFIKVFGKYEIGFNESSLTIPHFMKKSNKIEDFPASFHIKYARGPVPGFEIV